MKKKRKEADKEAKENAGTTKRKILAVDQATQQLGFAVFNGDDLHDYGSLYFKGDLSIQRIALIRKWLNCKVHEENIDFVVLEDIQQQKNVKTFRTLAQLLGVLECYLYEKGVPYAVVHVKTWRSFIKIDGDRTTAKKKAIAYIEKKYGIEHVEEDAAEAICMGEYGKSEAGKKPLIVWDDN